MVLLIYGGDDRGCSRDERGSGRSDTGDGDGKSNATNAGAVLVTVVVVAAC